MKIDTNCADILINTELEIDEPRFGLILFNVLSNSMKYTRTNDTIIVRAKVVKYSEMILEVD